MPVRLMDKKIPKKITELDFQNRLRLRCPFLFEKVQSSPLKNPKLLHVNRSLAYELEISPDELSKGSFLNLLNADLLFEGLLYESTYYSGHQFGHYVARLGDGRALMLGEIKTTQGHFFELQFKGSGKTPFSRMGDGRAVVRSSIREYLASAHLKALGIPTTEALSIVVGSDLVYREEIEKASITTRVAESFLRFGHFEYFSNLEDKSNYIRLLEFVIDAYFPAFSKHPNRYILLFQEVVKRTALLFAKWQSVGFCHGVLNTDNMSILGLTIDYGPYGFINKFDPSFICNHSDHEGRYSFGNQPFIGLWNLEKLSHTFEIVADSKDIERTLNSYSSIFNFEYRRLLINKLGLNETLDGDDDLIQCLLNCLIVSKMDYTQFFREISKNNYFSEFDNNYKKDFELFFEKLEIRLRTQNYNLEERSKKMLKVNPKFILRNHIAQFVIENHELKGGLFEKIFDILNSPYDEWPEFDYLSKPPSEIEKNIIVSCSS